MFRPVGEGVMFQILDTDTLLRLLDAPAEDVFHTIETGLWSGCIWPGNAEWELHEACAQVRSLAIHYVTTHHPEADARGYETLSQVLASQACPQGGGAHLDAGPPAHQAMLWLWALAGGPSPPESAGESDPLSRNSVRFEHVPGADLIAFTTTSLSLLEALIFTGEMAAHQVATRFLLGHHDALAQRGLELVNVLTREETAQVVEAGVTCMVCGAEGLDLWYSGQTWGDTLCEPCYEARVRQGQARPQG
jgi:hypothetical protein